MKQFKAEWQIRPNEGINDHDTILHLITKHNALCDYLKERDNRIAPPNYALEDEPRETITVPKPQWWEKLGCGDYHEPYLEALSDTSKASGIIFKIEE